ncbi:MAG: tetratricopeptide repeat protein, partial [Anaerolineae bacterium]|nr:tetratricopeptide repeat protein [Anaerolineae bacterium]
RIQFGQRVSVASPQDVVTAADVLVNGLLMFYIFLFLLIMLFAFILSWQQARGVSFARPLWVYMLALLIMPLFVWYFIWLKNFNVVRADIYLKEGDRYRNAQQWDNAIALHSAARAIDSDEDFYYLMSALDYQLMAQDNRLDPAARERAWAQGEQIALEARAINPYNPDNTGNMGRYYFTVAQVFDPEKFDDALAFFQKATVLAPSNVIYHNLWAQTHYIRNNYDQAIERLKTSIEIDPKYPPTWSLLGDTYAALGNVDEALEAHTQAMSLVVRGSDGFAVFADQFFDQRVNFYISADRFDDLITEMEKVALARPEEARIQTAIARAYTLAGRPNEALPYLERAVQLGDASPQTTQQLADVYLANKAYDQALPIYQHLAQTAPNAQVHSSLAFIYAQLGQVERAIEQNQLVLQAIPQDYDSLKNLAILYQQQGQLQDALAAAQQARDVAPESDKASWEPFIADIENQLNGAG